MYMQGYLGTTGGSEWETLINGQGVIGENLVFRSCKCGKEHDVICLSVEDEKKLSDEMKRAIKERWMVVKTSNREPRSFIQQSVPVVLQSASIVQQSVPVVQKSVCADVPKIYRQGSRGSMGGPDWEKFIDGQDMFGHCLDSERSFGHDLGFVAEIWKPVVRILVSYETKLTPKVEEAVGQGWLSVVWCHPDEAKTYFYS